MVRFSIPLIDWWQFKTILIPASLVQNETTLHWYYNLANVSILLPYHLDPIIILLCTTLIPVWYWFFANVLQLLYEFSATSFVRWYHFAAALDQLGYNVNTSPKPFPLSDILKHCPIWKEAHSRRLSSHQEKVLNWDQLELIKLNPVATKFFFLISFWTNSDLKRTTSSAVSFLGSSCELLRLLVYPYPCERS